MADAESGSRSRAGRFQGGRQTRQPASRVPTRGSIEAPDDEPLIKHASAAAGPARRPPRDTGSAAAAERTAARANRSIWRSTAKPEAPSGVLTPGQRAGRVPWPPPRSEQPEDREENAAGHRARLRRGDRSADPRGDRRDRHLLHDADLRADARRSSASCRRGRCSRSFSCRTAATSSRSRPAVKRSARWPRASAWCRPNPASLDLGRAFLRELMWFLLAVPAGLGFSRRCSAATIAGSTIASPARASSALLHDRRESGSGFGHRPESSIPSPSPESRRLLLATRLGVGYIPFAPGTFGSAAGLLLWALLPASPGRPGRSRSSRFSSADRGAAASRNGISDARIPGRSSSTK